MPADVPETFRVEFSNRPKDDMVLLEQWKIGITEKGQINLSSQRGAWHFKMYSFVTKFSSNLFLGIGKEAFILISRIISYSKHFPVQSEQQKYKKMAWIMFRVDNKDIRTTSTQTVYLVGFEQVNVLLVNVSIFNAYLFYILLRLHNSEIIPNV